MRHARASSTLLLPLVLAMLAGCESTRETVVYRRRPSTYQYTYQRTSPTGRTDRPRDEWPTLGRTTDAPLKPTLAVGLLTREGALQTIREASDAEGAIQALEARRFAFALDEATLRWFADEAVAPEVLDYLSKRARVDWEGLRAERTSESAAEHASRALVPAEPPEGDYAEPAPPATTTYYRYVPPTTTYVDVYGDPFWRDRWSCWGDPWCWGRAPVVVYRPCAPTTCAPQPCYGSTVVVGGSCYRTSVPAQATVRVYGGSSGGGGGSFRGVVRGGGHR